MSITISRPPPEHPAKLSDFEYVDKQQRRLKELREEIDFISRLSPREYHFFTVGCSKHEEKDPWLTK